MVRCSRRGIKRVERAGETLSGSDSDDAGDPAGDRGCECDQRRTTRARARAARTGETVRSRAGIGVLALISQRAGAAPAETRSRSRLRVPARRRPPWRAGRLPAVSACAPRARPLEGVGWRYGEGARGLRVFFQV